MVRPPDDMQDAAPQRTPARLRVGVPAVVAVVAVGAVPFVIDTDGDTSIRTAEPTTPGPSTTVADSDGDTDTDDALFSSSGTRTDDADDTGAVAQADGADAATVPGSTTTVPPITVDTLPTEPEAVEPSEPAQPNEPIAPPADPRAFEEEVVLGEIAIPSLGVDEPLLSGITLTTLDKAPGHWPGTALPGEAGNVVVAAHRTSHGGPFRNIDQLVAGDTVLFGTAAGDVEYRVTETLIVNPDAIWIVDQTDTATATLFACHPPGSVAQRIVVRLELA